MSDSKDVTDYIKSAPKVVKEKLEKIREIFFEVASNSVESISYGMPTYKVNNKPIGYFAYFKNHIGFYPTPEPIKVFEEDLKQYKHSKGAIQFPTRSPLPEKLIKKFINHNLKKNSKRFS